MVLILKLTGVLVILYMPSSFNKITNIYGRKKVIDSINLIAKSNAPSPLLTVQKISLGLVLVYEITRTS